MATIKLGDLTLGNIAIGGSTIGDVRKLAKAKIFRSHSLTNHSVDKTISASIARNVNPNPNPNIGIGSPGGDTWLLANGVWNDNGVWDDTQIWND